MVIAIAAMYGPRWIDWAVENHLEIGRGQRWLDCTWRRLMAASRRHGRPRRQEHDHSGEEVLPPSRHSSSSRACW